MWHPVMVAEWTSVPPPLSPRLFSKNLTLEVGKGLIVAMEEEAMEEMEEEQQQRCFST